MLRLETWQAALYTNATPTEPETALHRFGDRTTRIIGDDRNLKDCQLPY